MKYIQQGFYTAMGTPMNADGSVCEKGLRQHIENQITNGAAGLFIMGTMGCQPAIRTEEYPKVAQIASDAVNGRTALLVGAMDNSIARVRDRIKALHGCELTGVVLTTPFFFPCQGKLLINFFTQIADTSEFPVFLYDQPGVTNNKITNGDLAQLAKHPNILGIKTADISHVRYLKENHPDFEVLYSHSDLYAAAAALGVDKFLEGMFCATPKNARILSDAFNEFSYVISIWGLVLLDFLIPVVVYLRHSQDGGSADFIGLVCTLGRFIAFTVGDCGGES